MHFFVKSSFQHVASLLALKSCSDDEKLALEAIHKFLFRIFNVMFISVFCVHFFISLFALFLFLASGFFGAVWLRFM